LPSFGTFKGDCSVKNCVVERIGQRDIHSGGFTCSHGRFIGVDTNAAGLQPRQVEL
jgi:hypothetical protein